MDTYFYRTQEWRKLRIVAIRILGTTCGCCKTKITNRNKLHVDHVVPRSKNIELQLQLTNLQVLCEHCNCTIKRSNVIDYRNPKQLMLLESVDDNSEMLNKYPTIEQLLPKKSNKKSCKQKLPKSTFNSHNDNIKIVYNLVKSITITNNNRNDIQNVITKIKNKYSDKLVNKIIKQMIVILTYEHPTQQYSEYLTSGVHKILLVRSRETALGLLCDYSSNR